MTNELETFARLRVRFHNGSWVTETGRAVVAAPGTEAEIWLPQHAVDELWPPRELFVPSCAQFLHEGAPLRFALSIGKPEMLTGELMARLIPPSEIRGEVEWGTGRGRISPSSHFFEVTLGPPNDRQREDFPDFAGGLLVTTGRHDIDEIQPSTLQLPKVVTDQDPVSLNHAYTLLSEAYELQRASHTRNIYHGVFYQGEMGRWYPLQTLRALARDTDPTRPHIEEETAKRFWDSTTWWELP